MKRALLITSLLLLCLLAACIPAPNDAQIEAAVRLLLSGEAAPPELDFSTMEIPMSSSGGANAVLWTADGELQRNYGLPSYSPRRKNCKPSRSSRNLPLLQICF